MTALPDLLARVRAASGPDRELDAAIMSAFYASTPPYEFFRSVDAALALIERVLPGYRKSVVDLRPDPCEAYAWLPGWTHNIKGDGATPALALVAALLAAVIDRGE